MIMPASLGRTITRLYVLGLLAWSMFAASCTGPKAPEGKILVEFWDFPRLPAVQEWRKEAIKQFMKDNPDIHVEYTQLSWGKGGERLDIGAFARRPPDVAGSTLMLKYVDADLLAPIDKYLDEEIPGMPGVTWREDIHPAILESVQWEGTTYAFPWYKEAFVMVLNKDLFDERGVALPENGQWTWEEFLEKMHRLTFDRDGDGSIDVYGVGFNTGYEKWEAYSFLFAEGMQILSEDGRTMLIDSEATRRGTRRLLEMEYEEHVSLPGAGGIQDDTTWTAFTGPERRLAVSCQGLWAVNSAQVQNERRREAIAENPSLADASKPLNIDVALFPIMPGHEQVMASYGTGSYMVFNREFDPERTDAAARLARYLTLEAGQEINSEAGLFPSRISKAGVFAEKEIYKDILPYVPGAIVAPVHPMWKQLDQVISEQLQLILLKRVSVDEGVATMGKHCQIILDKYWDERELLGEVKGGE